MLSASQRRELRGAVGVGVEHHVVEDHRHRAVGLHVALERGEAEGQVELLAGARAHVGDRHLLAARPTAHEHRLVAVVVGHGEPLE